MPESTTNPNPIGEKQQAKVPVLVPVALQGKPWWFNRDDRIILAVQRGRVFEALLSLKSASVSRSLILKFNSPEAFDGKLKIIRMDDAELCFEGC